MQPRANEKGPWSRHVLGRDVERAGGLVLQQQLALVCRSHVQLHGRELRHEELLLILAARAQQRRAVRAAQLALRDDVHEFASLFVLFGDGLRI